MDDDLPAEVAPRCPDCHMLLEDAGSVERPFWWCPVCKIARLN